MSPHELYTLIDSFTNLKDFHLENFIEVFRSGTFSISGPPPIPEFKLDSLALIAEDLPRGNPYSSSKDTFFEWISKTQCPLTLKKLKLLIGKRDIQDRAQFLSMLQNRVEDLEILFVRRFGYNISDGQHESEMIANTINLGLNPGLKSLTLPDPANPAVCPLLSQVASPDIQTITFRIPIYRLEDMKRIDSHQLTRVLSARNMATVSEVRFLYTGSFAYDDVYATFKELLPEVAQKGILRVGQVAVVA
ncbi:hypothetical protein K474DRAFT_1667350 [Panus rudis PR-1116 ss-1]|nr:hypothetical protein K474DRAFT_1667350 [Panus rudis PR-1116 ss-1]